MAASFRRGTETTALIGGGHVDSPSGDKSNTPLLVLYL
jgi:hypothetical protein